MVIYTGKETLDEIEKKIYAFALQQCGWKQDATAKALGIHRRTLYRRIRKYGWLDADNTEWLQIVNAPRLDAGYNSLLQSIDDSAGVRGMFHEF